MNPEDEAELELLRRDVEALGGDPSSILARAQTSAAPRQAGPADFRDVGTYRYEYLDPGAPGAAPGTQQGPMADELKHLGVVKPGPQGRDMVDTAGLGFKNASATGELAREVESLRKEVDTLRGNPDAVLNRVNKPAPKPRQGRTTVGDADIGDIQVSAGNVADNEGFDRSTLIGAGQYDQEVLREEARQRKFHADVAFPYQQYVESGQAEPIQRAPEPRTAPRVYGQYRQQEELDFDQRQHDALRAMEGFGATDAERQRQIRQEIEAYNTGGPGRYRPDPRMSRQLADEMNIDPETGRTVGNVSEDEVRRALQRREELFL